MISMMTTYPGQARSRNGTSLITKRKPRNRQLDALVRVGGKLREGYTVSSKMERGYSFFTVAGYGNDGWFKWSADGVHLVQCCGKWVQPDDGLCPVCLKEAKLR